MVDIEKNGFVLTPGRYVGFADEEDDGIPFNEKIKDIKDSLESSMFESSKLDNEIKNNLNEILNVKDE